MASLSNATEPSPQEEKRWPQGGDGVPAWDGNWLKLDAFNEKEGFESSRITKTCREGERIPLNKKGDRRSKETKNLGRRSRWVWSSISLEKRRSEEVKDHRVIGRSQTINNSYRAGILDHRPAGRDTKQEDFDPPSRYSLARPYTIGNRDNLKVRWKNPAWRDGRTQNQRVRESGAFWTCDRYQK